MMFDASDICVYELFNFQIAHSVNLCYREHTFFLKL